MEEIASAKNVPTTVMKMLLPKLLHSKPPISNAALKLTVVVPIGKNEYPIVLRLSALENAIIIININGIIHMSANAPTIM